MRRGGGIKRKTPLKSMGARGERLQVERERSRDLARERDRRCENCNNFGYLEGAHAFGRGNQISEPMASWECMYRMLCRKCHVLYDNGSGDEHEAAKVRVGWKAIVALIVYIEDEYGLVITPPCTIGDRLWRPLDVARWYERTLRERGVF